MTTTTMIMGFGPLVAISLASLLLLKAFIYTSGRETRHRRLAINVVILPLLLLFAVQIYLILEG